MSFQQALGQPLTFVAFEAISFIIAREILEYAARRNIPALSVPALIVFGAASGAIFIALKLQDLFIWHMVFYGLVAFAWHRKSDVGDEQLTTLAKQEAAKTGADAADVKQSYILTRRLLSFGLISYFGAFCLAFYYLYDRR